MVEDKRQSLALAISLLKDTGHQSLLFTLSCGKGQLRSLLLKSSLDMLSCGIFTNLNMLYVQNPCHMSSLQLTGTLLGSADGSGGGLCVGVLPSGRLADLCAEALSYDRIHDFLRLCAFYYPQLEVHEMSSPLQQPSFSGSDTMKDLNLEHAHVNGLQAAAAALIADVRAALLNCRSRHLDSNQFSHTHAPFALVQQLWSRGVKELSLCGPECDRIATRIANLVPSTTTDDVVAAQKEDTKLLVDARTVLDECVHVKVRRAEMLDLARFGGEKSQQPGNTPHHSEQDLQGAGIPEVRKRHAWCLLALADALGARLVAVGLGLSLCEAFSTAGGDESDKLSHTIYPPLNWSNTATMEAVEMLSLRKSAMIAEVAQLRYYLQLKQQNVINAFSEIEGSLQDHDSDTSSDGYTDSDTESNFLLEESPVKKPIWTPPPLPQEMRAKIIGAKAPQNEPQSTPVSAVTTAESSPVDAVQTPQRRLNVHHHGGENNWGINELLNTPASALSTASSRRHNKNTRNAADTSMSFEMESADQLDNQESPAQRGRDLLCLASPRTSTSLKVDVIDGNMSTELERGRFATSPDADAARNAAAQRVKVHKHRKAASEQAEAAAAAAKAARLKMLALEASLARVTIPSGGKLSEKQKREKQQKQKESEVNRTGIEEKQQEKIVEDAQQRAAQRVKQRRTRMLTEGQRRLLKTIDSPNKHPPKSVVATSATHNTSSKPIKSKSPPLKPWEKGSPWPISSSQHSEEDQWVLAVSPAAGHSTEADVTGNVTSNQDSAHTTSSLSAMSVSETLLLGKRKDTEEIPFSTTLLSPRAGADQKGMMVEECASSENLINGQIPEKNSIEMAAARPVFIKVLRAWDLMETLGACNPYVELSWGLLGSARTFAVFNSTEPEYFLEEYAENEQAKGQIHTNYLKFRSPVICNGPSIDLLAALGEDISVEWLPLGKKVPVFAPPLRVTVYSARESVSDEWLGDGEIDALLLMEQHDSSHIVQLFDSHHNPAGVVEVQFAFE